MIKTLLSHALRRFFRSSSAGREMAAKVMLGFIALLVVGYLVALGFVLERIIVNGFKQTDPISFLNGLLVYYFVGEFITRYFMQSLPALDAQPYLHLPVARRHIVNFLLCRSVVHVINVFVFLLFTPFALNAVADAYGTLQAWTWLISLWLVSLLNHFLVLLFKKNVSHSAWGLVVFIVASGALAAADYFDWLSLSTLSEKAFNTALHGYTSAGVLILLVVLLYFIAYRYFIDRLYPEELSAQENEGFQSANLVFLRNFGLPGSWIKVELKLIFRHKRTREVFLMNVFFLLYALVFYKLIKNPAAYGTFLLVGIFSTGIFAANYGQFLFSWQAKHFDFTLTQPASIRKFVESKYWLLVTATGLWFLFSIPFVFFGWIFLLTNFVSTLFNVGINIFLIMNMAMWAPKRIDLTKGGTLNYEGMGAAQWVMGIPFIACPYIFFLPLSLAGYPIMGLVAVGVAGLMGIVYHKKLLAYTSRRLFNMRYAIGANFRKD